jgi:hypothetical protein
MKHLLTTLLLGTLLMPLQTWAQTYNQIDETGQVTQRNERSSGNFNPHSNDTTKNVEIPRGMHVWTVDSKLGDIRPAVIDTLPHLFMKTAFNSGLHGEYNTTGNNYTARQNRIFADRPETAQFIFTQPYSFINRLPEQHHFTNTLSPLTNASYYSCGDKTNGEDRLDVKFAVNANKRLGVGFDLDYAYARGYFSDQSASHFGATLFASYLGDRYQMHLLLSNYHQKTAENGGILQDEYITHPESFRDSYAENEIPTVLTRNWNRNDNQHVFLTHRYSLGFYRKVKMTEDEIKARQFALASQREKQQNNDKEQNSQRTDSPKNTPQPAGRPDNARIMGAEPQQKDSIAVDTTRIQVDSQEMMDSLLAEQRRQEAEDSTMKREFVPVTSFIHTLELNNHKRSYIGYVTPANYYAKQLLPGDSISDDTHFLQLKNTIGLALLEGFNKYAKAGLKAFATHEVRRFTLPDIEDGTPRETRWTEHNLSLGGKLSKTQGHTLHYNAQAEVWAVGEDAGQLKLDFDTDLNFRLLGDTMQLAATAAFHRLNPVFYQRHYHARNLWWDEDDLSKETRTRIEGRFSYKKTKTQFRLAVDEIQHYTYFGMSYDRTDDARTNLTASVCQADGNINLVTAQLQQDFKLGPLHWDNILTYQKSSNEDALPLPTLNLYTNLYLHFIVAKVLTVDLGADMTYFTKYYAPDFCPQLSQFAVQQNQDSRVELGEYPFVNVYANMHLKRARFFIMMSNAASGAANKMAFLAPHYPMNSSVLRFGISWNFFN